MITEHQRQKKQNKKSSTPNKPKKLISYEKFSERIKRYKYIPRAIYIFNSKTLFIEIESPSSIYFFVRVPDTHLIEFNSTHFNKLGITRKNLNNNTSFHEKDEENNFLYNLRDYVIDSDLLAINSKGFHYSKFNGETEYYTFVEKHQNKKEIKQKLNKDIKADKSVILRENHSIKHIKEIENKIKNLSTELGVKISDLNQENRNSLNRHLEVQTLNNEKNSMDTEQCETTATHQVFEEGIEDEVRIILSFETDSENSENQKDGKDNIEQIKAISSPIFVCTDIIYFYKNIGEYDNALIEIHKQIQDNEQKIYFNKVSEIKEKMGIVLSKLEDKLNSINIKKKGVSFQLSKINILNNEILNIEKEISKKIENPQKNKNKIKNTNIQKSIEDVKNEIKLSWNEESTKLYNLKNELNHTLLNYEDVLSYLTSI
jgi:hypothetical protein